MLLAAGPRMGTTEPLYGTPRSPERPTLGPRTARVAQRLGKPLQPWQRLVADVAGEIDTKTGLLAYSQVILIVERQQGKSELALPVMTHRCTGFDESLSRWIQEHLGVSVPPPGPQRVFYTAQTADDARKKWRDVHLERLKKSIYYRPRPLFSARLTTNKEALIWANGSMWSPGSTTGKTGGTGDTLDLPFIDEAWSRPDGRTELGMRPAMLTRPWRQMWVMSMIPGLSRAPVGSWPYLAEKRRMGRALVEAGVRSGVAFFDFTAAEGLDPDDPETWYSCMPALGRTISLKAVQEDHEAMCAINPVDFQAEYLGWAPVEVVPRWGLIRHDVWEAHKDMDSTIVGDVALGVEVSEDRQRGWIGAAGRRADGRDWHVEVVEPGFKIPADVHGIEWMVRRLVGICEAQDVCAIVMDARRPAFTLKAPLQRALEAAGLSVPILTPNQSDMGAACGRFYDAAGGVRAPEELAEVDPDEDPPEWVGLWHTDQPALNGALAQARRFELGVGAFVFVKKGQSGEIGPLYAIVEAMHGHQLLGRGEPVDVDDSMDAGGWCAQCGRATYVIDDLWVHAMDDTRRCGD